MKETQHTRDVDVVRRWLEVRSQHAKDAFERIVKRAEENRSGLRVRIMVAVISIMIGYAAGYISNEMGIGDRSFIVPESEIVEIE